MNREIKFRAWNKLKRTMLDWEHFKTSKHLIFDGSYSWMQYTGLKDNKGKEIYEGDILQDGKGGLGEVEYRQPQFVVWADEKHYALAEGKINMTQLEYTEIVGNIYENPELLKP